MSVPLSPLSAALLLLWIAPAARADLPQRLTWEELPQLIGKQVTIAMYDGGAVAGKVRDVQPGGLLIYVSKSTNSVTYPNGPLLVPRAKLYVLDVHCKGIKYRIVGTALGLVAGAAGAVGLHNDEDALDNAADRGTTTIRIIH